jgi:hypothetical protein
MGTVRMACCRLILLSRVNSSGRRFPTERWLDRVLFLRIFWKRNQGESLPPGGSLTDLWTEKMIQKLAARRKQVAILLTG